VVNPEDARVAKSSIWGPFGSVYSGRMRPEKKGVCFGLPDRPHSFCPDRKHFFAKVQECVKIEEEASKKHLTIELRMDFFVSRLLM